MLKLSENNLKITVTEMLKDITEKVDKSCMKRCGNSAHSTMKMVEINDSVLKNFFDRLINRLHTIEEGIIELDNMSVKIIQLTKKWKKKGKTKQNKTNPKQTTEHTNTGSESSGLK